MKGWTECVAGSEREREANAVAVLAPSRHPQRYCSSVTGSIQSTFLPSTEGVTAMWLMESWAWRRASA